MLQCVTSLSYRTGRRASTTQHSPSARTNGGLSSNTALAACTTVGPPDGVRAGHSFTRSRCTTSIIILFSTSATPLTPHRCHMQSMSVVYEDFEVLHHSVPYHSGFLGFREVPAYATLVARLRTRAHRPAAAAHSADAHFASTYDPHTSVAAITAVGVAGRASAVAAAAARPPWPQVFLVDGYGALHHRRCGSACHLGVHCGIPTVGVAKTLLHVDGLQERSVRAVLSAALAAVAATSPSVHSAQLHPAPGACAARPIVSAPGCSEEEAAGLNACGACVTVRSPRGEAVQSLDLVSEWTGEVLGVAVAGMHCTQKPIYVSTGVNTACCAVHA